jgi:hypothetical protein
MLCGMGPCRPNFNSFGTLSVVGGCSSLVEALGAGQDQGGPVSWLQRGCMEPQGSTGKAVAMATIVAACLQTANIGWI